MKLLLLDREENLVSVISEATTPPAYEEELNGLDVFELEVADTEIEKGYRLLFKDVYSDWREYMVVGVEEKHNRSGLKKKVYCESSFYELLGDWLEDIRPTNTTARAALTQAISTTRWEVGAVDDLGLNSTNFYRTDAKKAVEKIADVWDGEIKTRIEVIGNKITGRFIDLYKNRGTDKGKRFTYTKDIEEVERSVSEDLVITALHGFGKGEEIGEGFGRRLDFSSVNQGKTYLENAEALSIFGRNNADGTKSHIFGKVEFDDIEDKEVLKAETKKALDILSAPSVTYKAKVQDLSIFGYVHERVNLGDYVWVIDKEFIPELRFQARIVKIKRNLVNELETEITLGNVQETYTAKSNSKDNYLNSIRDKIGVLDKVVDGSYQLPKAEGEGSLFFGQAEPSNPHNGDIWFKKNGEFSEMWQYVDGQWILIISTADLDQVKKEVDAAQQTAEQAKQDAIKAHDDAVLEAGQYTDALRTEHEAMMGGIQQEANAIKQTADQTKADINTAITAAGFTSLSDSLTGIKELATTAEANAQKGIANAATALGQANSALSGLTGKADNVFVTAELAKKVALDAYNQKISQIDTAVNSQSLRIDKTEADLRLTAKQTDVDAVKGRLTTAELDIQASANGLKLKADKTEVTKAIEDIQVGGRNLLINSKELRLYHNNSGGDIDTTDFSDGVGVLIVGASRNLSSFNRLLHTPSSEWTANLIEGEVYTFSIDVMVDVDRDIYLGWNMPQFSKQLKANKWYRVSKTIEFSNTPIIVDNLWGITSSTIFSLETKTYYKNPKAEKGTKATDYDEAPEDKEARLKEVSTQVEVQAGLIAGKVSQSDFNVATGRITKAEAELVIQADAISKRVATTDFNALAGRVSETESVNHQQAGLIEQKVSNTVYEADINNPTSGLKQKVSTAETTLIQQADLISQKVNTTEFDSLKGTVTTQGTELTAAKNAILAKAEKSVVDTLTGRVSTAEGRLTVAESGLLLAATKTEVTTAIGETEKKINAVSASLSVEAGKVETLITKTDGQQTAINNVVMTANTNKATIYDHTGRISTVEQNVNGLQTTVASKASQTQVTQLDNLFKISLKQGINILPDADFDNGFGKWVNNAGATAVSLQGGVLGIKIPFVNNGIYMDYGHLNLVEDYYTVSIRMKTDLGSSANVSFGFLNLPAGFSKALDITSEWTTYTFRTSLPLPVNHPTSNTNFHIYSSATNTGNVYIDWVSLVRGDVASGTELSVLSDSINLKVSKGEVSSQINLEAGRMLFSTGKLILDANTYIMGTTFANDVKAKSLEAVDANIASIRAKILVTNVVESTHIKADTALVNKLFATTALIDTLTTKLAFINAVKAIDIAADRITTGTLNAANVNLINVNVSSLVGNKSLFVQSAWNFLDATTSITGAGLVTQSGSLSTRLTGGEVTTTSGTKSGKVNALGMEIYDSSNGQTTRLFSDGFEFNWYGIKRVIEQNSEGLTIRPISGSGNRLNSSLHLTTGSGADKVAYIDFKNPTSGNGARIILQGLDVGVRHPAGGVVQIADISNDGRLGDLRAGTFQTSTYDGRGLRIVETQINTLADNQTIYIIPSGTGELRIGSGGSSPSLWPVRASRFVEGSSRASKTNIRPYTGSALAEINRLQAVTFNRKEDLANGINYTSLGFIAEDSPFIAIQQPGAPAGVDHYKMATLALKGIQEMDLRTRRSETYVNQHELEIQALKKRISELEEKIA